MHAVMMCDGAGWQRRARPHRPRRRHILALVAGLTVPNSTPSSGLWLYLRERFSYRSASFDDTEAIIDACCIKHGSTSSAEPDRMRTLCSLSMDHEGDFIGSLV